MPRFRFVVMGALWMTVFFLFLDRVNISLAAPYIMDGLGLSGVEMGLILSVYYWGYIIGQLGGGSPPIVGVSGNGRPSCFSPGVY